MSRTGYLLLRRSGALFGVASAAVLGLSRQGDAYRVEVAPIPLLADEIVGVVPSLEVSPLAASVRRYWDEPARGWAVHRGDPVVVVDPERPPRAILQEVEGEIPDGE